MRHDTDEELDKRAKAADLIVLPNEIEGTNCGNCQSFDKGYCKHPRLKMDVSARWCCIYWGRPDSPVAKPSGLLTRFRKVMRITRTHR